MTKKKIWLIVLLIGAYITCQLIADVGATRFVQIGSQSLSAGTFVFALTLTLRDLIHKRLGKEWARAAIFTAALFNIFLAAYLWGMSLLPAPVWRDAARVAGWNAIFALVPAITIGSILAEMVSELVDTEVYSLWKKYCSKLPQWTRVIASNFISIPVDSLIFCSLAFSIVPTVLGAEGAMPLREALTYAAGGQIIFKALVTVVSAPLIYLIKD